MQENRQPSAELFNLAEAFCLDEMTANQAARLQEIVLHNPDAGTTFVEFLHMHALAEQFEAANVLGADNLITHAKPAEQHLDERRIGSSSDTRLPAQDAYQGSQSSLGLFAGLINVGRNSPVFATLCVATLIYGAFGFLVWQMSRFNATPGHQQAAFDAAAQSPVATLVSGAGCRWKGEGRPLTSGSPLLPGALRLASGVAEILLADGATVVLEGPANFNLETRNRGYLHRGKLVAIVPPRAIGFTVETDTATVVDLGTEFGIEVSKAGTTDVQVLQGSVDVNYRSVADGSKSPRRSVRMTAGSAKRFGAQSADPNVVNVTEIAPWLDKTPEAVKRVGKQQKLPPETKYATAVLADKPIGYWRFSDKGDPKAVDASGHGNHGEYIGFVSKNNPGICPNTSDQCIRFLGKAAAGYVQIRDFELPASFTVELWAKSETPQWNTAGWLLSGRGAHGLMIHPEPDERTWRFILMGDSEKDYHTVAIHTPAAISDRFHHYLGTYDVATDRACMYFDGVLVGAADQVFGDSRRQSPVNLSLYLGKDAPPNSGRDGEGWIDEAAFYDRVLSADSVLNHYRAAMNVPKAVKEESDSKK